MAQCNFLNEIKNCVRMDDPLTKGPLPRWQKKGLETSNNSINLSNVNNSMNKLSASFNTSNSRTPNKQGGVATKKTPSKTPSKTPKKSPGRAKTPTGGDRFIPNRGSTNIDLGHYKLCVPNDENEFTSPSQKEIERIMGENLHGKDLNASKVLAFQSKAPDPPELNSWRELSLFHSGYPQPMGFQNPLKVVYSHSKTPSTKSSSRYIPQAPDRILDAPDILDDYYLNLVDWNANNILAVALNDALYLWNATTGTIERLFTLEGNDYICSVSWMTDGATHLAVGNSLGSVQLWDCTTMKSVRKMTGHSARVSSLCWNSYVVTSGARSGVINHYDVRQRDYQVATVSGGHTQEVCGLKWSPDGKYLASGGNDNMLCVWPVAGGEKHSQPQPLYSFSAHQAAVKALSWCPWQPNILASGGGTADRTIRFWNCNTGVCLNTLDTKSQVCSLQWSSTYKELVSGHGFSNHQITIWRYPALTKVAELTGHTARVLHLAMSPDGSTILSAGADETLRLWKCFMPDPTKKKEPTEVKVENSIFRRGIR